MIFEKKKVRLDDNVVSITYDGVPFSCHDLSVAEVFQVCQLAHELGIDSEKKLIEFGVKKLFELGIYNYAGNIAQFAEEQLIKIVRQKRQTETASSS